MTSPTASITWLPNIIRAANTLAALHGSNDDMGRILDYMGELAPNRPEIVAAQVRVLLLQNNHAEARILLAQCEQAHPASAVIKAMTAICMYLQGDAMWETVARDAATLPANAVCTALLESLGKTSGRALPVPGAEGAHAAAPRYEAYVGLAC